MTRLKEEWISDIKKNMVEYDAGLVDKTGMTLIELAAKAIGISEYRIRRAAQSLTVASVPITAGQGIIGQFSQSVAAIVHHMGFKVIVTDATDVNGVYEAWANGVDCIFMADDERFVGFNKLTGFISENNRATTKGYIAALEQMSGGLKDKEVLVLGYGTIGKLAVSFLKEKGAVPIIYEKDSCKTNPKIAEVLENDKLLKNYQLIIDATNAGGWLCKEMLHREAWIAAPGIPLALDDETYQKFKSRVVHDWLELGTAVMLAELCI